MAQPHAAPGLPSAPGQIQRIHKWLADQGIGLRPGPDNTLEIGAVSEDTGTIEFVEVDGELLAGLVESCREADEDGGDVVIKVEEGDEGDEEGDDEDAD